jgi:hypothetical protein
MQRDSRAAGLLAVVPNLELRAEPADVVGVDAQEGSGEVYGVGFTGSQDGK